MNEGLFRHRRAGSRRPPRAPALLLSLVASGLLMLGASGDGVSVEPEVTEEARRAAGEAGRDSLEARMSRMLEALVAPCCWNQTLSSHQSPLVDEMKTDIRARLERGEPEPAIIDSYVERYGARVLSKPPPEGFHRLLYLLPPLFLLVTGVAVAWLGRRLTRRAGTTQAPTPSEEAESEEETHLRELLRREVEGRR